MLWLRICMVALFACRGMTDKALLSRGNPPAGVNQLQGVESPVTIYFDSISHPEHPIEGAILDGFADVLGGDGVGGGEVGDGARDL